MSKSPRVQEIENQLEALRSEQDAIYNEEEVLYQKLDAVKKEEAAAKPWPREFEVEIHVDGFIYDVARHEGLTEAIMESLADSRILLKVRAEKDGQIEILSMDRVGF